MVLAVLAVLAVGLGLILMKAVPIVLGTILVVVGLVVVLAIGERRDRPRQRSFGDRMSRLDPNRAVLPVGTEPQPDQWIRDQVDVNIWTQPPRRDDS